MKNLILCLICSFISFTGFSQTKIGTYIGFVNSNMVNNHFESNSMFYNSINGINTTFFIQKNLSKDFLIQLEIAYNRMGTELNDEYISDRKELNYLNLPFLFSYESLINNNLFLNVLAGSYIWVWHIR